jgi:hypothetical protein
MRRAFVACVAFALVVVTVAVRFGFKDPAPPPAPRMIDAAIADAAIDAPPIVPDAAPPAEKHVVKPAPARPIPKPKPKPVITTTPPPVIPIPGRCTAPNPKGCPATEPNVNRPCDAEGVHCTYGASCCPPIYVCNNGVFEAWFTHCQ